MVPLKLDTNVDLVVPPSKVTKDELAAIRRAIEKQRKSPGYAERVAALDKIIERIDKSNQRGKAPAASKNALAKS